MASYDINDLVIRPKGRRQPSFLPRTAHPCVNFNPDNDLQFPDRAAALSAASFLSLAVARARAPFLIRCDTTTLLKNTLS